MAMDAKDLRTDSALSATINDGNASYNQNSTTLQTNRKKSYQDIGSNSSGKVESQATRPCAIIGPDRVLPPPPASDVYLKKAPIDPWSCNENVYRHQSDLTQKLPEYQQVQNISPRQTFQENMQRIMVPPSFNSTKNINDANSKNPKVDMPLELKYCDVPYSVNPVINGQKSIRSSDIPMTSVNPAFARSVPPLGWASSVSARPLRPYGAPEFYQYPDLPNYTSPRPMPRPHRTANDDSAQVHAERLYQDGNVRYKPYPTIKERFPQARYDYANNYPNTFHPHAPFPPQKYDLSKSIPPHPYPMYSQVPMRRIAEPILDSYQRSNQPINFNPYHNQYIPPPYGPVSGNCIQNKMYAHPSDISAKPLTSSKLPYDMNNKIYLEYENNRNKMYPPVDNMYYTDLNRQPSSKGDVALPMTMHPGLNMQYNMPPQYMYRKDNIPMKTFDNIHHRSIDQNVHVNNPLFRHPIQFSPSGLVISPADSNASNDTIQTLGALQEDCGYVSQSSTASGRSIDSGNYRMQSEMYRKYENFYSSNTRKFPKQVSRSDSISNRSDKKGLNVRQFLQMWNEGEEEVTDNNNASTNSNNIPSNSETITNQEQLYVLGLVNIPNEDLSKYEHIQKISKLPENIKGYNSIELLDQYEQLVESPALRPSKTTLRDYQISPKAVVKQSPQLSRPVSPLDVEAKISQSVIHKEVGCNFEIKPCSPKMLNVEVAAPVQNILDEREIEKVINLGIVNSSVLPNKTENTTSCKMNSPFISNNDMMKSSNYSFQDLESNSGVCLASLPRLDSDIELNFPEINQQFIDANKMNTNSGHVNSDIMYVNNLLKPASEVIADRETPKLSKYRKNKTYGTLPDDIGYCSAINRTDSVIIKNPDNIRKHEEIVTNITIIKENKLNDNIIVSTAEQNLTHNISTLSKNIQIVNDSNNIAIDFSLNKMNEKHDFIPSSKNLLVSMNAEDDDQKVKMCNSNNDIESEVVSMETIESKKDNSYVTCKTKYNTELSLCLPSCEEISLESICDEKSKTKKNLPQNSDIKNIEDVNKDAQSKDQCQTIMYETGHCIDIDHSDAKGNAIESNLPLFNGDEKVENKEFNNEIVTANLYEKKEVDEKFVTEDISKENFTVEDTGLGVNELLLNNENENGYNKKSLSEIEIELSQTTSECGFYNPVIESVEDNVNDRKSTQQKELSKINDDTYICKKYKDLSKDFGVDQVLNIQEDRSQFTEHSEKFRSKGDKKEYTLKIDNTTASNTQKTITESKIASDLSESSSKVSLNNDASESEIQDDGIYSNCIKQKQIWVQNNIIDEQDICCKENTCLDNVTDQFFESQKKLQGQNTDMEEHYLIKDQEIENKQSTFITSIQPTLINMDLIKTEANAINSMNNANESNVDNHNDTIKKNHSESNILIDNMIICEKPNNLRPEHIPDDFLKVHDTLNQATENEDMSVIQNEIESIEMSPPNRLIKLDKEENETSVETSLDASENNSDDTQLNIMTRYESRDSNIIFPATSKIDQNFCLENISRQMSEIQETKEDFNSLKIPESEYAHKLLSLTYKNKSEIEEILTSYKQVTEEINQRTMENVQCRVPTYFRIKYFSPRIQNLIIYNEGTIFQNVVQDHDVTDQKILDRNRVEDMLSETNNLKADKNATGNVTLSDLNMKTEKRNHNTESLHTKSLSVESDTCDNGIYNNNDNQKEHDHKSTKNESNLNINDSDEITHSELFEDKTTNLELCNRRITLKRSLSDSALGFYNDNLTKEHGVLREFKRRKLIPDEMLEPHESEVFNGIIQNNRRNSIDAICNNQNVFILIDHDDEYVITQDGDDSSKICFTDVSTAFCNPSDAILNICVPNESKDSSFTENFVSDNLEPSFQDQSVENEIVPETWVEDIACVETIFNDDVAEDIIISAPSSPENLSKDGNDDVDSAYSDSESEHIVRIKEIYGDNLCLDDVQLVETLYKTPQMNINKTLVDIESQNIQGSIDCAVDCTGTKNSELKKSENLSINLQTESFSINNKSNEFDDKENEINKCPLQFECQFPEDVQNDLETKKYVKYQEYGDCIVDSCDLSTDDYKLSENKDSDFNYSVSSSPEVSSTTSEEKGSSILLKITSVNGSRRSQINSAPDNNSNTVSYKLTEIKDYTSNYRPLITKAAKKYIPPLKESHDLKIKLPLPQQSLYKLKQLKIAKSEHLFQKTKHISNPIRHDAPKKLKPKFEDVLKSIDEIQFKMHREKNKKTRHSIPKVVIKKNENGAHYASLPIKKSYNPDLTGRKWQPWVFIERNELVDKMAQTNKVKAVYCHRKKTFVLAEKFKKYKSTCTAKFVITQPSSDNNSSSGNLKYTIRLKHNY